MTVSNEDKILREGKISIDALWADFSLLWTQYQSWQDHDRLLAESQDRLNLNAPDIGDDLKRLLGTHSDLEQAGVQLRTALEAQILAFNKAELSPKQQKKLGQVEVRLKREQALRALSQSHDLERDR